ncbi:unnamed protein product [Paramecium sonneborni]|uniref:Fatty acid desaturase domain-containing protein n=1 Tax=Paramecium sonneborni TaxID=65129 RepID=A0A8S1KPA9_9CILI|nr:unnamed protein product [Paramecium sonneborni]
MQSKLLYYIVPILQIITITFIDNPWIILWSIYVIIPLLDEILAYDFYNPKQTKELEDDMFYKIPLYLVIVLDWCLMFTVLNHLTQNDVSLFDTIGLISIWGGLSSNNFTVGHELLHKDTLLDKFLGTYTLVKSLYCHYNIEHVFTHHRYVGTPLDAVSAEKGQSLHSFIPKAIVVQWKEAWKQKDKMQRYTILNILMCLFIYKIYSIKGFILFLIQVYQSIAYLEASNYIEHYGLRRKLLENNQYEQISDHHSWNAPHRITNHLLFKLQRHSDHHKYPSKPYQILEIDPNSPILPCGYLVSIMIAQFPIVWMNLMDPLITGYKSKQLYEESRKKVRKFLVQFAIFASCLMIYSLYD